MRKKSMAILEKAKYSIMLGFVIVLMLSIILTSTLAFQDFEQHKTNRLIGGQNFDVVLVNDFMPVDRWTMDEKEKKSVVFVQNNHSQDDAPENVQLGDIVVRMQIKEYMEVSKEKYVYSEHRYMIDADGDFYKFDTLAEANQFTATLKNPRSLEPIAAQGYFDKKEYYYIPTQAKDSNGQYGLHLVMDIKKSGEAMPLIVGSERASEEELQEEHHAGSTAECDYPIITFEYQEDWDDLFDLRNNSPIKEHIRIKFGPDFILYDDWIKNPKPVDKWIIDHHSPEGYIYWGNVLGFKEETSNLIESYQLRHSMDSKFYFTVHYDLEAAALKDVKLLRNIPQALLDMYSNEISSESASLYE